MSELRREVRQRTFLKGRIIYNNGNASLDCLIRDLSDSGARLTMSESLTLPEVFDLLIPAKGRTYKAKMRWRREDGMGVTFVTAAGEAAAAPVVLSLTAMQRRIQQLEDENANLRRLLTEAEAIVLERMG